MALLEDGTKQLVTLWDIVDVLANEALALAQRPDSTSSLYELNRKEIAKGKPTQPLPRSQQANTIQ